VVFDGRRIIISGLERSVTAEHRRRTQLADHARGEPIGLFRAAAKVVEHAPRRHWLKAGHQRPCRIGERASPGTSGLTLDPPMASPEAAAGGGLLGALLQRRNRVCAVDLNKNGQYGCCPDAEIAKSGVKDLEARRRAFAYPAFARNAVQANSRRAHIGRWGTGMVLGKTRSSNQKDRPDHGLFQRIIIKPRSPRHKLR